MRDKLYLNIRWKVYHPAFEAVVQSNLSFRRFIS
jgi:hypothetical protein